MSEVKINMRELKASIADVLPVMKAAEKSNIVTITHALVESTIGEVYFQATDRFCAINSVFAREDGGNRFPEFRFFVDIESLNILKAHAPSNGIEVTPDGFTVLTPHGRRHVPGVEQPGDWPNLQWFIDGAWDDPDYFTVGENTKPAGFNPLIVKHIKDVVIHPRLNDMNKPSRIKAHDRVKGVIMPISLPEASE